MTSAALPAATGRSGPRRGARGGARWLVDNRAQLLAATAALAIAAGALLHLAGDDAEVRWIARANLRKKRLERVDRAWVQAAVARAHRGDAGTRRQRPRARGFPRA